MKIFLELDYLNLKVGNISTLFGRGTSLNLSQDQNADYDNTINGILLDGFYSNFNLTLLIGENRFYSRTNPTNPLPDRFVDNQLNFLGATYTYESFLFGYGVKKQSINLDSTNLKIALENPKNNDGEYAGKNQFLKKLFIFLGLP